MADEKPKKGNGSLVPVDPKQVPTPAAAWQTAPPGPPGAAIEPPPCSPSGVPFQVMEAPAPLGHDFEPISPSPFRPGFCTFVPFVPQQHIFGPYREPLYHTDQNAMLGKPISPDQMKRLEESCHFPSLEKRGIKIEVDT